MSGVNACRYLAGGMRDGDGGKGNYSLLGKDADDTKDYRHD